ncbi:bifunctional 2-polyprenyl-6-hydroxyphenol methylase/3-demethylubiquinol 3-O-methyltransferase UbiG [Allomuricauda sp. NBRC 101325]|uniref:class I SAM-dependent methyltransferase n=1 Tax=Allomuricauda sp. NBRC 101325 TaxID=1113758 RepID=UPI0024A399C0|nr:class I SAM-dependent methyltransferase [Muricauda sp. NBRC 101325]GLU44773.1 methyltransferase [Muricauda sp. NBRC 101325]
MGSDWLNMWNTRFGQATYAYGTQPNVYLKAKLDGLEPGTILFGAEGEGRNAVYAAKSGWQVSAFDISEEGRKKTLKLAAKNQVDLDYQIGELNELGYQPEQFDAIALIYAHFPPNIRSGYHKLLNNYLKKGGIIIFEAFSKDHLEYKQVNPKVGGPNNVDYLFSLEEIQADFANFEIIELKKTTVQLNEGVGHVGMGSVIRFMGKKK